MSAQKIHCISEENPSCKGLLHSVRIDKKIKTLGGMVTLRDLEVLECSICKERFYPAAALKKISAQKKYSGKFVLRVAPELHATLAEKAQKHHRSLNQEVAHLLETALQAS